MTEAEWLACADPTRMVRFVRGRASDRKLRLFACACARWTWESPPDERCRVAVEAAERVADAQEPPGLLAAAYRPARRMPTERHRSGEPYPYHLIASADAASRDPFDAAFTGSLDAGWSYVDGVWQAESPRYAALAELARDVFGNPFEPVPTVLGWPPAVVALADAIYDDRAFDRLPDLAEALEAAGCGHPGLLAHCRTGGPHARGCWAVDLVLKKG